MSFLSRLYPFSWLKLFFPKLNSKLVRMAIQLHTNTYTMAFNSEQTVAFLDELLETLKSSRATTKAALAAAKAQQEALAPLQAENSRITSALTELQRQVDLWTAQDAAEDAALARIADFVKTVEEPAVGQGDDLPVGLPPAGGEVPPAGQPTENLLDEVPAQDGVDLTNQTDSQIDANDDGEQESESENQVDETSPEEDPLR